MCIVQLVWTVHGIVPKRWRRCHICVTKMSDEMPSEREERKHILTGCEFKNDEVTHIHWPLLSSMCCTRPQTIFSKWSALTYCFYPSYLLSASLSLSFSWQFHIDANASVIFIAQQTNSFGMTLSPDKWQQQCRPKREAIWTKKMMHKRDFNFNACTFGWTCDALVIFMHSKVFGHCFLDSPNTRCVVSYHIRRPSSSRTAVDAISIPRNEEKKKTKFGASTRQNS